MEQIHSSICLEEEVVSFCVVMTSGMWLHVWGVHIPTAVHHHYSSGYLMHTWSPVGPPPIYMEPRWAYPCLMPHQGIYFCYGSGYSTRLFFISRRFGAALLEWFLMMDVLGWGELEEGTFLFSSWCVLRWFLTAT